MTTATQTTPAQATTRPELGIDTDGRMIYGPNGWTRSSWGGRVAVRGMYRVTRHPFDGTWQAMRESRCDAFKLGPDGTKYTGDGNGYWFASADDAAAACDRHAAA